MEADVELHQGLYERAAERFANEIRSSWFRSPFLAGRAEVYARVGRDDAAEAIEYAERNIGEHRYGLGILLRAKGVHTGDEAKIRESMELFAELECPYQEARSGCMLGGEARERAAETFERLGASLPAD